MKKNKSNREAMKYFGMATQVGLNVIVSFGIWIFIGTKIQDFFSLGNWVIIISIIFGLISASYSITSFIKMAIRDANKTEKEYKDYLTGTDDENEKT